MESSAATGTSPANAFYIPFGGCDTRSGDVPGDIGGFRFRWLLPKMFFGPGGLPLPGVNTPLPHSAPNAATSPFYKILIPSVLAWLSIPMHIQAPPVSSGPMQSNSFHSPALIIRVAAITSSITSRLSRQRFLRQIVRASTARSRAICATNT